MPSRKQDKSFNSDHSKKMRVKKPARDCLSQRTPLFSNKKQARHCQQTKKLFILETGNQSNGDGFSEGTNMKTDKTIIKTRSFENKPEQRTCFDYTDNTREIAKIRALLEASHEGCGDDMPHSLYDMFLMQTLNVISLSPSGQALISDAISEGWYLGIDDLEGNDFSIDVSEKAIFVSHFGLSPEGIMRSAYFSNVVLINLVRALRDAWHEKRHGTFDTLFGPEAILMLERVRAADCDILGILVAWELRSEGHSDIWRHAIGSESGDLAMAYSHYLERDPSSQFNGKALKAVFKEWFACEERINACDHQTLEYMDEILKYSSKPNPFGKKVPTHIGIELLSCLPDKTAYLQGFGREILQDPMYSGLDDPLNQSHLMHILYDLEVVFVNNVPFRDAALAARIFPDDLEILSDSE